jgi:hypothetical protein
MTFRSGSGVAGDDGGGLVGQQRGDGRAGTVNADVVVTLTARPCQTACERPARLGGVSAASGGRT